MRFSFSPPLTSSLLPVVCLVGVFGSLVALTSVQAVSVCPPETLYGSPNPPTPSHDTTGSGQLELGVSFTPSVAGSLTAVRFYKPSGSTPTITTRTVNLWLDTGSTPSSVVASATASVSSEISGGWNSVSFSTAVALTAGQKYIVSYGLGSTEQFPYETTTTPSTQYGGPDITTNNAYGVASNGVMGQYPGSHASNWYFVTPVFVACL